MASVDYAKRLLNKLTAENVERVLDHPAYWKPVFCNLFLDRCDDLIFHDPQRGLPFAVVAPRLAIALPEEDRREHRARVVRGYAILGGAYRAVGKLQQAEEPYRIALKMSSIQGGIEPTALAELYQRLAVFRACQKRFDEATRLGLYAARVFREEKQYTDMACALAVLGFVYNQARRFSKTLKVLSEALGHITPKTKPRVHYSALHNFAYAALYSNDLGQMEAALPKIREARRLITHYRRSVPKYQLYWVEGLLMVKLCLTKRGEQLFNKARVGFIALEAPHLIALVSLSLSSLYCLEGRWSELEAMAAETYERFQALAQTDTEALAALKLWTSAVTIRTLKRELIAEVQETMLARMVEHRAAP